MMSSSPAPPLNCDGKATGSGRKHRPGFTRIQVACEYCRRRKQKCDGTTPSCLVCVKSNRQCSYPDRLTYRQYPRGYVESLENRVRALEAGYRDGSHDSRHESEAISESPPMNSADEDTTEPLISDFGYLSLEGTSERRYIGSSSGVHFARILKATFKWTDRSRSQQLPGDHGAAPPVQYDEAPACISVLPDIEVTTRLADSFFATRWPQHPFIHKPTFFSTQFQNATAQQDIATPSSDSFIALMVFAIGAIDVMRHGNADSITPLQYYKTAMEYHLDALISGDELQAIQGLILLTMFAINEPRSLNVWHVVGLMVRMCIDIGLHREPPNTVSLFQREIRKRIFWSVYIFDRSVSLALGRPLTIIDSDINVGLPLNLTDEELVDLSEKELDQQFQSLPHSSSKRHPPLTNDMSAFLHIIRLRQLNAEIQKVFYPIKPVGSHDNRDLEEKRRLIRLQLDEWLYSLPRYNEPTKSTFQSIEWFQIAFHNSQIILHRPSPACPVPTAEGLQICYIASVKLIKSYTSLRAKNKITYTWVALLGMFLASVTMLYTLCASSDVRNMVAVETAEENIEECISVFKAMSLMWPIANRCIFVIESLGPRTLLLIQKESSRAGSKTDSQTFIGSQDGSFSDENLLLRRDGLSDSPMSQNPGVASYQSQTLSANIKTEELVNWFENTSSSDQFYGDVYVPQTEQNVYVGGSLSAPSYFTTNGNYANGGGILQGVLQPVTQFGDPELDFSIVGGRSVPQLDVGYGYINSLFDMAS